MKWIRQRDYSSCGPVALLNLQKWAGRKISYNKDFRQWKEICRCTQYGTELPAFREALHLIGVTVLPRKQPTVAEIEEGLRGGRCAVMKSAVRYSQTAVMGHYFLVVDQTPKKFFCVNIHCGHCWVPKRRFEEWYLERHDRYFKNSGVAPFVWFCGRQSDDPSCPVTDRDVYPLV